MNVVDSSGWIEYFTEGPNSAAFAEVMAHTDQLVVPTISIYEVYRWVLQKHGESDATFAIALMQQGKVVDLSVHLALEAARTRMAVGMPMADSIILATARASDATLWTLDSHFAGIQGVRYIPRV